ncbi:hypothetical protein J3R30DRAFT_1218896 [Lentinula aciculospora]|uniref:FAD-binding domain-containing protein n=1 Tax=Lentinula aciculospora TaxID=153920 RepID=A0A9W8ZZ26_9AGAR|nr:hypothetical protein J3R30DRAFT_1218896 [Lentinula aciculospora]
MTVEQLSSTSSGSTSRVTKFRIAIVGGGIGGLACAVALKNHPNVEIDLYEQAAQITEIGAGIVIWPRTWDILKSMGLEKDLAVLLKEPPSNVQKVAFEMRLSDRKEGFTFRKIFTRDGGFYFHRSDLQNALLRQIPESSPSPFSSSPGPSSRGNCTIHLLHRLTHCEETPDSVKLFFENGFSTTCDLAIGADGIKSAMRKYVVNGFSDVRGARELSGLSGCRSHEINGFNGSSSTRDREEQGRKERMEEKGKKGEEVLVFTGSKAFRGLVTRERFERLCPGHRALVNAVMYNGKSKHIVVYPINGGRLINIAAFVSHPEDEGKMIIPGLDVPSPATTGEILDAFSGWEPEAIELLRTIENPSCWPILDLRALKTYTSNRILLLGDAAHAMTPHLGAGAGQAIEDAFVLGYLFSTLIKPNSNTQTSTSSLLGLIRIYDAVQRPFATHLQKNCRKQGYYNELNSTHIPEFRDILCEGQDLSLEQIIELGSALRENWDSWWQDCAVSDLEMSLGILRIRGKL